MLKNKPRAARLSKPDLAAGDTVVVLAGKDKGKRGEVLRTLPLAGKIVVRGVNLKKRHTKAGSRVAGNVVQQGGIVDFESPLDYSNVMLFCPACERPTRIRHTFLEGGRKVLQCVKCGEPYQRVRRTEAQ